MIRLFVPQTFTRGLDLEPSTSQIHYLLHVMRVKEGQNVYVFNGKSGEWETEVQYIRKRSCRLHVKDQTRSQTKDHELWLLFSPLKPKAQAFLIEKTTEIGVTHLCPVTTEHSSVARFNINKGMQQAIEAAEQSGRITIPQLLPPQPLQKAINERLKFGPVLVGDETHMSPPLIRSKQSNANTFLVGPEGGWSSKELEYFRNTEQIHTVDLMANILRAETAGIIGLATLQQIRNYK